MFKFLFTDAVIFLFLMKILSARKVNGFSTIGDALEIGNPCENYILTVERLIGGPPSRENYWDGTVNLQSFKNLSEATITMRLSAPAVVTVGKEDGQLLTTSNPYNITFYKKKEGMFQATFRVQGLLRHDPPNLAGLLLNGQDICPNLQELNETTSFQPEDAEAIDRINRLDASNFHDQLFNNEEVADQVKLIACKGSPLNSDGVYIASVSIFQPNSSTLKCRAEFITPNHLLTTRYCVTNRGKQIEPENFQIKLNQTGEGKLIAENVQVKTIKLNENFSSSDGANDIAIIELVKSPSIESMIKPICLWSSIDKTKDEQQGAIVYSRIFGETAEDTDLINLELTLTASSRCQQRLPTIRKISLCGIFDQDTELCDENVGSGAFVEKAGLYYLRGLLAYSENDPRKSDCRNSSYVEFIDITKHEEWIRLNTI